MTALKTQSALPNADRLFKIHDLVQLNFLHGLRCQIYLCRRHGNNSVPAHGPNPFRREIRLRLLHPTEDRYFWCLAQFRYLFEHDTLVSVVGKITDIDEQKPHEDYLIGKFLKRTGSPACATEPQPRAKIRKHQNGAGGTLLMIDVDNFKQINDQFGHTVGDSALIFLADCLQKTFRSNDILGRAGGMSLSLIWKASATEILLKEGGTADVLHTPKHQPGSPLYLCQYRHLRSVLMTGMSYEELFTAADQAMYEAKNRGKCRLSFMRIWHDNAKTCFSGFSSP